MNSLPNNQIPRLHTAGQKYRDRQLILQMPRQDLAEELCKHILDASSTECFYQFIELRDEVAFSTGRVKDYLKQDQVGQGRVREGIRGKGGGDKRDAG